MSDDKATDSEHFALRMINEDNLVGKDFISVNSESATLSDVQYEFGRESNKINYLESSTIGDIEPVVHIDVLSKGDQLDPVDDGNDKHDSRSGSFDNFFSEDTNCCLIPMDSDDDVVSSDDVLWNDVEMSAALNHSFSEIFEYGSNDFESQRTVSDDNVIVSSLEDFSDVDSVIIAPSVNITKEVLFTDDTFAAVDEKICKEDGMNDIEKSVRSTILKLLNSIAVDIDDNKIDDAISAFRTVTDIPKLPKNESMEKDVDNKTKIARVEQFWVDSESASHSKRLQSENCFICKYDGINISDLNDHVRSHFSISSSSINCKYPDSAKTSASNFQLDSYVFECDLETDRDKVAAFIDMNLAELCSLICDYCIDRTNCCIETNLRKTLRGCIDLVKRFNVENEYQQVLNSLNDSLRILNDTANEGVKVKCDSNCRNFNSATKTLYTFNLRQKRKITKFRNDETNSSENDNSCLLNASILPKHQKLNNLEEQRYNFRASPKKSSLFSGDEFCLSFENVNKSSLNNNIGLTPNVVSLSKNRNDNYVCKVCNRELRIISNASSHVWCHVASDDNKFLFYCTLCNSNINCEKNLYLHFRSNHPGAVQNIVQFVDCRIDLFQELFVYRWKLSYGKNVPLLQPLNEKWRTRSSRRLRNVGMVESETMSNDNHERNVHNAITACKRKSNALVQSAVDNSLINDNISAQLQQTNYKVDNSKTVLQTNKTVKLTRKREQMLMMRTCSLCEAVFESDNFCESHAADHFGIAIFKCGDCGISLNCIDFALQHNRLVHPNKEEWNFVSVKLWDNEIQKRFQKMFLRCFPRLNKG